MTIREFIVQKKAEIEADFEKELGAVVELDVSSDFDSLPDLQEEDNLNQINL